MIIFFSALIKNITLREDRPFSHTVGWAAVVILSFVAAGYIMVININVSESVSPVFSFECVK